MRLLILYTKDRNEIFNKKMALSSYVHYLGILLNTNQFEVLFNQEKYGLNINTVDTSVLVKRRLSFIKKMIPRSIKRFIKERQHLLLTDKFMNELINYEQRYDAILEYYNLGSNVGLELAKYQNENIVT